MRCFAHPSYHYRISRPFWSKTKGCYMVRMRCAYCGAQWLEQWV